MTRPIDCISRRATTDFNICCGCTLPSSSGHCYVSIQQCINDNCTTTSLLRKLLTVIVIRYHWKLYWRQATYRHWSVSLWRDPDDVSHCRILSSDKTEWRLISDTLCGWRRCFVADQLWFITRIREEEELKTVPFKSLSTVSYLHSIVTMAEL